MHRIQVGCGYSPIKGWTNYDFNKFVFVAKTPVIRQFFYRSSFLPEGYKKFMRKVEEDNIQFANAGKHIPELSNSVDILYSSHMLEHLDKEETDTFLKEAYRVLTPGGYIRIVVPDFDTLIHLYQQNKDPEAFLEASCLVGAKPKKWIKKLQYIIQGHGWHFSMYNAQTLRHLFRNYGFVNVLNLKQGETYIPNIEGVNLSAHQGISLYLEAQKPSE